MKVTTAVIFASGFGSRMLPVTAAVQKELLPILDRPVIDYVVSDCIAAGISQIIFVIRPNSHALQDYYVGNTVLESHLERFGKHDAIEKLRDIHSQATFTFVEQPESAGYGTGAPLKVAIPHLPKDEAFVVCSGDDFLWRTDGGSDMKALVEAFSAAQAVGAIMSLERPDEELHKYGVLEVAQEGEWEYLREFVEKPAAGEAPSNMINISKYIMTPQMIPYVKAVKVNSKSGGELYVTDAVAAAAKDHKIVVQRAQGAYLDSGSAAGWLKANLTVAASRPEMADVLADRDNFVTKH
ncbi:MAG TPA: sugar phosphate nucleotidyltransferase [Candidatus Saccharimonadia bacterium]